MPEWKRTRQVHAGVCDPGTKRSMTAGSGPQGPASNLDDAKLYESLRNFKHKTNGALRVCVFLLRLRYQVV